MLEKLKLASLSPRPFNRPIEARFNTLGLHFPQRTALVLLKLVKLKWTAPGVADRTAENSMEGDICHMKPLLCG